MWYFYHIGKSLTLLNMFCTAVMRSLMRDNPPETAREYRCLQGSLCSYSPFRKKCTNRYVDHLIHSVLTQLWHALLLQWCMGSWVPLPNWLNIQSGHSISMGDLIHENGCPLFYVPIPGRHHALTFPSNLHHARGQNFTKGNFLAFKGYGDRGTWARELFALTVHETRCR